MKIKNILVRVVLLGVLALSYQSCKKVVIDDNQTGVYKGFDFKTVAEYDVQVKLLNSDNQPINAGFIELFTSNPLDGNGQTVSGVDEIKVFQGLTDQQGIFSCKINPPTYADSLFILIHHIGLPEITKVALNNKTIFAQIGGNTLLKGGFVSGEGRLKSGSSTAIIDPVKVNGLYVLGTWDNLGVPDYKEAVNDVITNAFLNEITASLPEYKNVAVTHPQYLASTQDVNLDIVQDAEVWVTFVHEGAGWLNVLGYYTYPTGNAPATKEKIRDLTVIFPNVSYLNSGGGLNSGNKVKLWYLNPVTNKYSNVFPAGVTIGWFIKSQGWSSSSHTVTNGAYTNYSDVQYNIETDPTLRKHNVVLFDAARNLFVLGFEDMRRDVGYGSDNDFNDAVFYGTLNPVTAVNKTKFQALEKPGDSDGDGTTNTFDQYPNDPARAFNNYYPAQNVFGSLVFEDLWPSKGDYDFNDMVVDYNFNQITNSNNQVKEVKSKIKLKAIGASYHSAFGISMNTSPSNVESITGQRNTKDYLAFQANKTEAGQSKAVIICFDDAYNMLHYPGTGIGVNTVPGNPYVVPETVDMDGVFVSSIAVSTMGTPPYNPFIIINRNRGVEVHLPGQAPTDLANTGLFGTGDDNTDPAMGKYYVSDKYLPWAINLPVSFDYPIEKKAITTAYLMFNTWATSQGKDYPDWYLPVAGYRNSSNIYSR